MNKKEQLLKEYENQKTSKNRFMTVVGFLDFLVDKIEQLENPNQAAEIEVQKGGETNGNT